MSLANHPAIVRFANVVSQEYELTSDEPVVMDGATAVVRPENPPYRKVKYVNAFVEDLEGFLVACGFKYVDPHNYKFEGHGLTAYIENVDVSDPETSDPIEVQFYEP